MVGIGPKNTRIIGSDTGTARLLSVGKVRIFGDFSQSKIGLDLNLLPLLNSDFVEKKF